MLALFLALAGAATAVASSSRGSGAGGGGLRVNEVLGRIDGVLDKEMDLLLSSEIRGRDQHQHRFPSTTDAPPTPDPAATKAFADDPMVFVGTNIVNSLSLLTVPGSGDNKALQDLLASKPAQVSFVVTKDEQHYLEIAVEPLESAQPAQWLGYLGSGAQDTADKVPSISVPASGPAAGKPAIVLTGALNGCSIIATADPAVQGNILFYHDSAPKEHLVPPPDTAALARLDYSKEEGGDQGQQFYATAPDGTPLCDLAKSEIANSLVMLVFAQGQWNIVAQPQCIVSNGMNKGGLKVVRKTGSVLTIPVTLP